MKNINSWLFLLIAVVWLLQIFEVGFIANNNVGDWINVIAIGLIGVMGLMNK